MGPVTVRSTHHIGRNATETCCLLSSAVALIYASGGLVLLLALEYHSAKAGWLSKLNGTRDRLIDTTGTSHSNL